MLSRHSVGAYQRNQLTRSSLPQLSQPAEPLWIDPGLESGVSVCKLVSPYEAPVGFDSPKIFPLGPPIVGKQPPLVNI